MIDPEKKFRMIPQIFYYSIKENHIIVNILEKMDSVVVEILPGPEFKKIGEEFRQTFKKFGFEEVAQDGFTFKTEIKSPTGFMDKAMSFAACEDEYFFPHFLENTQAILEFDSNHEHLAILDKFASILLPDRRLLNFSAIDYINAEVEVDLDSIEVITNQPVHKRSC